MAKKIWVVLQLRSPDGGGPEVARMSWEAIAAAQKLASLLSEGGKPEAVILGSGIAAAAEQAAAKDLAAVRTADAPALGTYTPGAYVAALAPAIAAERPDFVVFPHTYQSVDYVPRLAQATGSGLLPEVTGFAQEEGGLVWTRPILGGKMQAKVRVQGEGTVLVSVQAGSFPADSAVSGSSGAPAPIQPLATDLGAVRPDREVLGVERVGGEKIDLTKADAIVAVGRGVGGADKMGPLEELAKALGAEIGASRPVIDNGWLPRDRQIGSSGQTVAPRLYLALGISGAIQHLVGMKGAATIVAINKDPGAPIFTVADYGIVGDLHELVPALTAAVKEAKGQG
jgi:electron transfer flavoprotein alpha subunit